MTDEQDNCVHDQRARMKQLESHVKKPMTIQTVHGVKQSVDYSIFCQPEKQRDNNGEDLYTLIDKVIHWHYERNLIEGSTDKDQVLKLAQELGELSDSVCKSKDIKDDIGDMLVVMLNIAERNGVILAECLQQAWNDIKNRKGRMIDGIFVKETDL